jgi:hypothetical protein
MMARVGRLAGALLAETGGEFFLVGNTKEPCDFEAAGFQSPGEIDWLERRYIRLAPLRAVELAVPYLRLDLEGEALAALLAERLLIDRNASVSDRLWRLVIDPSGQDELPEDEAVDARWLTEIPAPIWGIVRDTVLRCL